MFLVIYLIYKLSLYDELSNIKLTLILTAWKNSWSTNFQTFSKTSTSYHGRATENITQWLSYGILEDVLIIVSNFMWTLFWLKYKFFLSKSYVNNFN